jgi:hypothetical protein
MVAAACFLHLQVWFMIILLAGFGDRIDEKCALMGGTGF